MKIIISSKVPLSYPHRCIKIFDLAMCLYMMLYFYVYLCLIFNPSRFRTGSCFLFLVLDLVTGNGNLKISSVEVKKRKRHDGNTDFFHEYTAKTIYVCIYIYEIYLQNY